MAAPHLPTAHYVQAGLPAPPRPGGDGAPPSPEREDILCLEELSPMTSRARVRSASLAQSGDEATLREKRDQTRRHGGRRADYRDFSMQAQRSEAGS